MVYLQYINVPWFSLQKTSLSFVVFTPKYILFIDAILNIFKISFFNCFLLVSQIIIDFNSILVTSDLTKFPYQSQQLFYRFFRIFYIKNQIISIEIVLFLLSSIYIFYFTSYFILIVFHFTLLKFIYHLISMARTTSTILNKSGRSQHSYLVPNLGRKHLLFYH